MKFAIASGSIKSAVITALTLLPCVASADGSHGAKIEFTNLSGSEVTLESFNGKDSMCGTSFGVPHKVYYIGNNGTRTAKCHGQGKGRCKIYGWWTHHSEVKVSDVNSSSQAGNCFWVPKNAKCSINYTNQNWN